MHSQLLAEHLARALQGKSRPPQPGTPFPWVLAALLEDQMCLISGNQTATDPDKQQRCLSCYFNEMGCCYHVWAGNDCPGVDPASQEVQTALRPAWMGAVTSLSSIAQACRVARLGPASF